ncbi:MAG: hypothetical protein ACK57V_14975 [Pirellula sp.]
MANNLIPDNYRTSTSPETPPLEDTALVRKPACESTRREQSDEENIEYNPSATACNVRMAVPEPKVEHHEGRGVRSCPIFSELRPYLDRAWVVWQESDQETDFVINKQAYRDAANTGDGWKCANLRTQFLKKLAKAGIPPWKRLFHSMRASRQTELERQFPLHVVCSWLGNTEAIAKKNYLLVKDSDFEQAIQGNAECNARVAKSNAVKVGSNPKLSEENLEIPRGNSDFSEKVNDNLAEETGFEPAVRS